jgi:hypothetical protein
MSCIELQKLLEEPDKDDCFSRSSSAKENGKKFIFENKSNKTICRVRVDDCLITSKEVKKCDFLFKVNENNKYYLIELKGIAVIDAVAQIINTFEIVNIKVRTMPENYKGISVSSSVPSATEQKFRMLQDKCYREKHLRITKTHIQHTERV